MQIKLDTVGDQFLAADLKVLTAVQKTQSSKKTRLAKD